MIRLNVHEAKTHLSRYHKKLAAGETIIYASEMFA
jgi:antitoxin (DNA-binding transcriptional repressor) of toxin-antitoxin stability system